MKSKKKNKFTVNSRELRERILSGKHKENLFNEKNIRQVWEQISLFRENVQVIITRYFRLYVHVIECWSWCTWGKELASKIYRRPFCLQKGNWGCPFCLYNNKMYLPLKSGEKRVMIHLKIIYWLFL